jgi:hypothetical protein
MYNTTGSLKQSFRCKDNSPSSISRVMALCHAFNIDFEINPDMSEDCLIDTPNFVIRFTGFDGYSIDEVIYILSQQFAKGN